MAVCTRCQGFINTTYREYFDPSCINCGCTYPELSTPKNGNKKSKGLRETIRYTGNTASLKEQLGYITYSQHPNRGSVLPKLTVACPMCKKEIEVLSSQADPFISSRDKNPRFINGYKTAKNPITCPEGHRLRLKIDREGMYSWE